MTVSFWTNQVQECLLAKPKTAVQVGDKEKRYSWEAHEYLQRTLLLQFLRPCVSCLVSNFREYSIFMTISIADGKCMLIKTKPASLGTKGMLPDPAHSFRLEEKAPLSV